METKRRFLIASSLFMFFSSSIKSILLILLLNAFCTNIQSGLISQVTIQITDLPDNTPEDAELFFASNISNWNPGDPDFKFILHGNFYTFSINNTQEDIEYKITRGTWSSVEGNANGGFRPNRTIESASNSEDTIRISVLSWEDLGNTNNQSTASENVFILDEAMRMSALDRSRRIWVYLPPDYDSSGKYYPVIYMQDGQNLFDRFTAFAGEWEIDETLDQMYIDGHPVPIVVGIDNGGSHRIDEYSPFVHPNYGGGEADQYLDFVMNELKPRIDSTYRTLKTTENTLIMGSSMGGLISHYAHFAYPDVFGKAGIFSPSYWFSDEIYSFTVNQGRPEVSKLYIIGGSEESGISAQIDRMESLLESLNYDEDQLYTKIVQGGRHNEAFWSSESKEALLWLLSESLSSDGSQSTLFEGIKIQPNPADSYLLLTVEHPGNFKASLLDANGRTLQTKDFRTKEIRFELPETASQYLFLRIISDSGKQQSFKILKVD